MKCPACKSENFNDSEYYGGCDAELPESDAISDEHPIVAVSTKPKYATGRRRWLIPVLAIAIVAIAVAAAYTILVKPYSPEPYDWSIQTIDYDVVGWDLGQGTSISTDSNNGVHICYYDGKNSDLKYATNSSGVWLNYTLDSPGDIGKYNSMAIDSSDNVHISYWDTTNKSLKYVTNAAGSWVRETVCQGGSRELSSIAVDSKNEVYIGYRDPASSELKYATKVNGSWTSHAIAVVGSTYCSIAAGSDDSLHVVYSGRGQPLTYATNAGGEWVFQVVDHANCFWCSIALGANDEVHIGYYYETQDYRYSVKYASNEEGTWTSTTLYDDVGNFNTGTSIAVDSNNNTHMGFFDSENYLVMYATDEGGSWECHIVDDGKYVGEGTSMTIDSVNRAHFSYFDKWENDLKHATVAASR